MLKRQSSSFRQTILGEKNESKFVSAFYNYTKDEIYVAQNVTPLYVGLLCRELIIELFPVFSIMQRSNTDYQLT